MKIPYGTCRRVVTTAAVSIVVIHQTLEITSGEPKSLDDQCPKVADTSVGYVANKAKQEEQVQLVVLEGLFDLIRLELLVLNSSLIGTELLYSPTALLYCQETCSHGRVWQE